MGTQKQKSCFSYYSPHTLGILNALGAEQEREKSPRSPRHESVKSQLPRKPRFLCFFWSSLMTGTCHHLRPAAVFYDDRPKAQKAVLSIAGAKIRRFLVSDKFRHVIRVDFQQKHLRFETSLKNELYFLWGASLCFCDAENYVLRYKSAYYEVIPDYGGGNVFSIQFFSLLFSSSV